MQPFRQTKIAPQQMPKTDEQDTSRPSKKLKQNNVPTSRLVLKASGFKGIYNDSFPLDLLSRFLNRHQYGTSTGGLYFYTDTIRQKAMRGAWKLSSSETVSSFLEPFARLGLEE